MYRIKIGNRYIGDNESCFIIVEIGINHNGDVNLAKKMVECSKSIAAELKNRF